MLWVNPEQFAVWGVWGVANWLKTRLGLTVSCLCVQLRS